MTLLLDTHALIWWLAGDASLSPAAHAAIAEPGAQVFVSAVSAMEVATKHRLGKLPGAGPLARDFAVIVAGQSFAELPLSIRHAQMAGSLTGAHKDPFDRMLIAQALTEDLALVSRDTAFDAFAVRRFW